MIDHPFYKERLFTLQQKKILLRKKVPLFLEEAFIIPQFLLNFIFWKKRVKENKEEKHGKQQKVIESNRKE